MWRPKPALRPACVSAPSFGLAGMAFRCSSRITRVRPSCSITARRIFPHACSSHTQANTGKTDNQIFLQYIMSLGTHAAHTFRSTTLKTSTKTCLPHCCCAPAPGRACRDQRAPLRAGMGSAHARTGRRQGQRQQCRNALQDRTGSKRPGLITHPQRRLARCTGLELEAGWLPVLVQQSGNAKVAVSQRFLRGGQCRAAPRHPRQGRPQRERRARVGQPHIQQNPHNIALVAVALAKRLGEIDLQCRHLRAHKDFRRWNAAMLKWEQQAAPLLAWCGQHPQNMEYLMGWLGMRQIQHARVKPGVRPAWRTWANCWPRLAPACQDGARRLPGWPRRMVVERAHFRP